MRESFVFHAEYIVDLPDEYKARFAMYAINYALNDEKPDIEQGTLEYSLWAKIERRINQEREKYERVKERRSAAGRAHKGNQYTSAPKEEPKPAEEKREEAPAEKPKTKNFEKPTVEEIAKYCSERKNGIDPQVFFDFYESKGWKVGAVKMKDWRASVRTWEQRHKSEGGNRKAGGMWGNENEIPDEITDLF